ncbi:unnamed protein product [Urochloa decumbens]|uniref:Late embryogenesis abundant protein LEA-2 subgroup domain-containing protein n=1 Tax=Urochloa decumbens TaxID=240449 RepID=A0ABC9CEE4_9POAL
MVDRRRGQEQKMGWPACCCFCWCTIMVCAVIYVPIFLFVPYTSVSVTVDDASLDRLSLAAPGNGTAFLSYNLSLTVAVRNGNVAIRAWRTAPLDAELRFRGRPFAAVRLAGAGDGERGRRIRALTTKVYRVAAAAERAPVELGSDRVAEFARERVAGEFQLGLIVAGQFKYQAHRGRHSIKVSCPLKLSLSTSTAPAAFARVKCTEACEDDG